MNEKKHLPLQESKLERRTFLLAACGICVSACGPGGTMDGGSDASLGDAMNMNEAGDTMNMPEMGVADGGDVIVVDSSDAATCTGQDAGALADFPMGMPKDVMLPASDELGLAPGAVVIVRDSNGLYAMSGLCLHFGGRIAVQNGMIRCTNVPSATHGAQYDINGINTVSEMNGPPKPQYNLATYKVSVCNGRVFVDRSQEVARATRTRV